MTTNIKDENNELSVSSHEWDDAESWKLTYNDSNVVALNATEIEARNTAGVIMSLLEEWARRFGLTDEIVDVMVKNNTTTKH